MRISVMSSGATPLLMSCRSASVAAMVWRAAHARNVHRCGGQSAGRNPAALFSLPSGTRHTLASWNESWGHTAKRRIMGAKNGPSG
jgi:hypothetical protein